MNRKFPITLICFCSPQLNICTAFALHVILLISICNSTQDITALAPMELFLQFFHSRLLRKFMEKEILYRPFRSLLLPPSVI